MSGQRRRAARLVFNGQGTSRTRSETGGQAKSPSRRSSSSATPAARACRWWAWSGLG